MASRQLRLLVFCAFACTLTWFLVTVPWATHEVPVAPPADNHAGNVKDTASVQRTAQEDVSRLQDSLKALQTSSQRWITRLNSKKPHSGQRHGAAESSLAEAAILNAAGPNFQLQYHSLHKAEREETIFVGVTCQSRVKCTETLKSLFGAAARPRQIYVGLVEHRKEFNEPSEFPLEATCDHSTAETCWSDQMRSRRFEPNQHPGVAFARASLETMYRNERFVMFVTAPVLFAKNWDTTLIEEWGKAAHRGKGVPQRTVVLSHALPEPPAAASVKDDIIEHPVDLAAALCEFDFVADEALPVPKNSALPAAALAAKLPIPVHFVSRDFFFMERLGLAAVPMDGALRAEPFLSDSFLLSARFWTSGFSIFSPTKAVVTRRSDAPAPPEVVANATVQGEIAKVITGIPTAVVRGMGKVRPVAQFLTAVGADLSAKKDALGADGVAKRCAF